MSLALSETPKTGFVASRPSYPFSLLIETSVFLLHVMNIVMFQNEADASVKTRLMHPSNENASVNADMNIK